jgi:hypothetical protein
MNVTGQSFFQKPAVSILRIGLGVSLLAMALALLSYGVPLQQGSPLLLLGIAAFGLFGAYRSMKTPVLVVEPGEIRFRNGTFWTAAIPRTSAKELTAEPTRKWGMRGIAIKGTEAWVPASARRMMVLDGGRTLWIPLGDLGPADRALAEQAIGAWAASAR